MMWSVGSFVAGALFGAFLTHRFAFGRDVHKEWRAARAPVIKALDAQVVEPYHAAQIDFSDLRWRFNRSNQRKRFDTLVSEYEASLVDQSNIRYIDRNDGGEIALAVLTQFVDADKVRQPARRLIEFLKRL